MNFFYETINKTRLRKKFITQIVCNQHLMTQVSRCGTISFLFALPRIIIYFFAAVQDFLSFTLTRNCFTLNVDQGNDKYKYQKKFDSPSIVFELCRLQQKKCNYSNYFSGTIKRITHGHYDAESVRSIRLTLRFLQLKQYLWALIFFFLIYYFSNLCNQFFCVHEEVE